MQLLLGCDYKIRGEAMFCFSSACIRLKVDDLYLSEVPVPHVLKVLVYRFRLREFILAEKLKLITRFLVMLTGIIY